MSNSEETTEITNKTILKAIEDTRQDIKNMRREYDSQFEAIRQGLTANSAAFDRLEAKVLLLRADVKDLTEEVHQINRAKGTLELK